jgi:hypothetical protein
MTMGAFENPFLDFLEEGTVGPRASFFSRPGAGGTRSRSRFFEKQFDTIFDQFLGQLGSQIRGGQAPTATFGGFLDEFDFNRFFSGTPPTLRGVDQSRFAPRTRSIFNF